MDLAPHDPLISVVVLAWNSAEHLPRCLQALAGQTCRDFEVILVDNGSSDGCLEGVEERFPGLHLRVERLATNIGFAAANNLGARMAGGKWLVLLNSDAFAEPGWMEALHRAAVNNPGYSFFASRQLQAQDPALLDGAGDALHISGLAWRRYAGWPADRYGLEQGEVFSACAAAAMYSRAAFSRVGGFDEDFFSYHEDVDLGFRLRLQGFRCLYVPGAVVQHVGSVSQGAHSDFAVYHWQRNFIWSFIQNMPGVLLWRALPAHLLANVIQQVSHARSGEAAAAWKGKWDALRGLGNALKKRRQIQKKRICTPAELLQVIECGTFQPYLLGHQMRRAQAGPAPVNPPL